MGAYSFKKRFGPLILAGTKAQTIRADRKRHARRGEELQLYTGMRTKFCRKLGEPAAVHHRVTLADAYFQVASLTRGGKGYYPMKQVRARLAAGPLTEPGTYPPLAHIHAYRDITFAANEFAKAKARKRGREGDA